ncbi:MAG: ABC transporter permease [Synergistetes bacterium]|nr:ABC transporter permease [Synergistota bacterium]
MNRKGKRDYFLYLIAIIGSFLVAYIALPIIVLFMKQACDISMLIKILKDEVVIESLKNTLLTSTISTLIAITFGVPLGYFLARKDFRGKGIVQGIIDLPVVIPHSVVGIMLLITFSEKIIDSYTAIVMAMLFVSASFVVNSARDGFIGVDEKLEYVARTLGATKLKTLLSISIPIALPSIASGAIMAWARAISEVGAILIVAYYPKTAQVLAMEYFNNYGLKTSRPIAVILMVLSLGIFTVLRLFIGRIRRVA